MKLIKVETLKFISEKEAQAPLSLRRDTLTPATLNALSMMTFQFEKCVHTISANSVRNSVRARGCQRLHFLNQVLSHLERKRFFKRNFEFQLSRQCAVRERQLRVGNGLQWLALNALPSAVIYCSEIAALPEGSTSKQTKKVTSKDSEDFPTRKL